MTPLTRFLPACVAAGLLFSSVPSQAVENPGAATTTFTMQFDPEVDGCRPGFAVTGTLDGVLVVAGTPLRGAFALTGEPAVWSEPCVRPSDGWLPFDMHVDGTDANGHVLSCFVGVLYVRWPYELAGINGSCTVDGGPETHLAARLDGVAVTDADTLDFAGLLLSD